MKLDTYLTLLTRINSKWNKTYRPETIKLLKKKKKENLFDIDLVNKFWDMTPTIQGTNASQKVGLYQAQKLLHSKINDLQNER